MPISPEELKQHAKDCLNIEKIKEEIDDRLKQYSLKSDLTTPIQVVITCVPTWVLSELNRAYKAAGWAYVRLVKVSDPFMYIEIGAPE